MAAKVYILRVMGWFFGLLVFAIGIVNTFWGNDPLFGVFLLLLACIYFPPIDVMIQHKTGWTVPPIVKVVLGILIIWASLGVGELFDKVDLMLAR